MPNKTKQDYLNLVVPPGASRAAVILADAVANKLCEGQLVYLRKKSTGYAVGVRKDGVVHDGEGADRAEAIADACGKFVR